VWDDDLLRRMSKKFLGHEDLDVESVLEDMCQALKGIELVVRVGVATKKDGASVSLDLFDVAEQVNSDGCLAAYKAIVHDVVQGLPAIAPACCRHVTVNDLGPSRMDYRLGFVPPEMRRRAHTRATYTSPAVPTDLDSCRLKCAAGHTQEPPILVQL